MGTRTQSHDWTGLFVVQCLWFGFWMDWLVGSVVIIDTVLVKLIDWLNTESIKTENGT